MGPLILQIFFKTFFLFLFINVFLSYFCLLVCIIGQKKNFENKIKQYIYYKIMNQDVLSNHKYCRFLKNKI